MSVKVKVIIGPDQSPYRLSAVGEFPAAPHTGEYVRIKDEAVRVERVVHTPEWVEVHARHFYTVEAHTRLHNEGWTIE